MSRGPGWVQRGVHDYLATDPGGLVIGCVPPWVPLRQIAAAIHGVDEPNRSQLASTRRAVRQLAATGAVTTRRSIEGQRTYRARRGGWLVPVRLTETDVRRAITDSEKRTHCDALVGMGRQDRAAELYPDLIGTNERTRSE